MHKSKLQREAYTTRHIHPERDRENQDPRKLVLKDFRVIINIGQLRTMLACQYSFGATVGAPVVFFLGAFGFTIVSILSNLGDQSTSLALAFGMWYMILPHM